MTSDILAFLRVSERPEPPPGSGTDLAIFRASEKHLGYRFAGWGLKQLGTLVGLLVSLAFLGGWDLPLFRFAEIRDAFVREISGIDFEIGFGLFEINLFRLIALLELFALATFLFQLVVSAWWLRLRWRLHWYMVGEEMLRIREGLWTVREQTFTIAKVQNLTVHQNVIQRFLGIGDLEVHTAGGGQAKGDGDDDESRLHVGWFRGMDDPWSLRDRIRGRLGRHADSGLGDDEPEDEPDVELDASPRPAGAGSTDLAALVEAAEALRAEARHLSRLREPDA